MSGRFAPPESSTYVLSGTLPSLPTRPQNCRIILLSVVLPPRGHLRRLLWFTGMEGGSVHFPLLGRWSLMHTRRVFLTPGLHPGIPNHRVTHGVCGLLPPAQVTRDPSLAGCHCDVGSFLWL